MKKLTKEEKEIRGTFEPSKEPLVYVEYDQIGRKNPPPPTHWPFRAQQIWKEHCAYVRSVGYLKKSMMAHLRRYCFAVYQAERAEETLLTEGFVTTECGSEGQTYEVVSKWVTILDNANKTIERYGSKFGFSPLDVQKIPAVEKKQAAEMSLLR